MSTFIATILLKFGLSHSLPRKRPQQFPYLIRVWTRNYFNRVPVKCIREQGLLVEHYVRNSIKETNVYIAYFDKFNNRLLKVNNVFRKLKTNGQRIDYIYKK